LFSNQVDVRDHKSVQGAVDETMLEFDKIDVLVAAAGIAE
jgi:NADP-dependent 3-hydroxy acid dehydrogenase YdfG